jgi:hypothetical protein
MPFYPWSAASHGMCSNPFSFHCFHLGLTVESIKEFGGASSIFTMCEDYVYSKRSMPYTWKKVGALWKAFNFIMSIVKRTMCWTWMLNLLEEPIPIYYTFLFELNLNFSLTLIYVYLFIDKQCVQWWMMHTKGKWSKALAGKEDGTRQSLKHLKTQPS